MKEELDREASDTALDITKTSGGLFHEFLVDVLGSLVPGIAFLLAAIPAVLVPSAVILFGLVPAGSLRLPMPHEGLPASIGTIVFVLIPAFLAFLTCGYIAGHLFFRQDPKLADLASFKATRRNRTSAQYEGMCRPNRRDGVGDKDKGPPILWYRHPLLRTRSALTETKLAMARVLLRAAERVAGWQLPPPTTPEPVLVEFPYHFLKAFLTLRGLQYLADVVSWDERNFERRTKHRVNALKIRIQLESPILSNLLARNEAHVRLSSSMWYVSRVLMSMSVIGALVYGAGVIVSRLSPPMPHIELSPVIALPVVTFVTFYLAKRGIERSLHYQREREVLYILEAAYWLHLTERVPNIFSGLEPEPPPV